MPRITAPDGVELAVSTYGDPGAPTLVCVHGYPDNASLWDDVVAELASDFHVVTYDVRGAGASDHPRGRSSYRLERLEADFTAVLDAVCPSSRPVHVLAHDWGSIQAWHFVTSPELRDRIASYVSISGPCLDHAGFFLRTASLRALRQLLHSWYIFYFHVPGLAELGWRQGWGMKVFGRLERAAGGRRAGADARSMADFVNGLELYRANVVPRLLRPTRRTTSVPVMVVSPDGDAFVGSPMQTEVARWAPELTVRVVRGGHWMPRNDPGAVAELVREHTSRVARWQV